jgi:hypothetical protein
MKKVGLVILVIGLVITLFTGFQYVTREKVVDIGEIQISRDKTNSVSWSPFVGLAIMAIGAGMFVLGPKK